MITGTFALGRPSKYAEKNFEKYQNKLNKMFQKLEKACHKNFSEVSSRFE